ncbi:hypothetical protein CONLIGDRAFT_678873 [Coniochaeta ligniaria NRRL 30616]|uniref:Uncharacterized protein n=1 Tax=Coniochaeta ligniaria NRRL 30616 TaxID=1408157 RepID=A0A1J7IY98_9PEZI|nr:hypothetical protein CONLIGDRAFT_678873 [Coniochaeta ligniaria NRRL 30616]
MADSKKVDNNPGNAKKPPTTTRDPVTTDEMLAAHKIFSKDLAKALEEQKSSGSTDVLEARIANLKAELQTLEQEIKSSDLENALKKQEHSQDNDPALNKKINELRREVQTLEAKIVALGNTPSAPS